MSEFEIRGDRDVILELRAIRDRSRNLTPVWPKVRRVVQHAASRQFATSGAYLGKPWKPLDPDYKAWKVRNGYDPRTLIKTGHMRNTFTRNLDVEAFQTTARFSSRSRIATYHQHGTSRGLPARPIIFKTVKLAGDMNKVIADYITNGVT